jgi:hypothetical protein
MRTHPEKDIPEIPASKSRGAPNILESLNTMEASMGSHFSSGDVKERSAQPTEMSRGSQTTIT